MDEEQRYIDQEQQIFYENQMDFFGQKDSFSMHPMEPPLLFGQHSMQSDHNLMQVESPVTQFKAYNPMDMLRNLPEHKHSEYMFMLNNHKRFSGIQHFFQIGNDSPEHNSFLENIDSNAMESSVQGPFALDKLFVGEATEITHQEVIKNTILTLNKKLSETASRTLGSVHIGRTISNSFYEHFQNFGMVFQSSNFLQEFAQNLKNMIAANKKMKGPGVDLMVSIYDFWMKSFKDFVNQIWRYSSKYTLNFFKKNEPEQENADSRSDYHSESSNTNTIGSKDKRKGWSNQESEILLQLINSNIIFSQSALKKLSEQFGRSVSSISSKIQKLSKFKKGDQQNQQESLLQRTIQILKMHPYGLNRESILQKLNQNYQMGYGGQWQKSVGQLLSSRKEFIKKKAQHRLLNIKNFHMINLHICDKSKLTFKDKVVQVFLRFEEGQADLRSLVDKYIQLFEQNQEGNQVISQDRRKSIEANISKTISRYQIFDGKGKTIYKLHPFNNKEINPRKMEAQLSSYFDL